MADKTRPSPSSTLADRVRETMRLRNIGVNELGRRMNRKPGYVSAMLSQNRSPRAQNLTALAQALGVHLAWLADGAGPRDMDTAGGAAGAANEDWVRALDRSDPFPNRRQLKLLDVYRSASTAVKGFLDDVRFFPSDRPTVEEWLRELALAASLERGGLLERRPRTEDGTTGDVATAAALATRDPAPTAPRSRRR